jgi:DNA-binding response OmpR family regulator/tetratricopeptide (TPR) repeat protein
MGLLIIESRKEKLDEYKKLFGEENNHFVAGLNDSLMLLETVFEFDLAICNYKLDDATGKDLHENFRMLPETENVPILFVLDIPDNSIENLCKKMSLTDYLISPDNDELKNKVNQMIINEDSTPSIEDVDDFSDEGDTAVVNNQFDFDSLINNQEEESKDNQIDFDSLMNEISEVTNSNKKIGDNENTTKDLSKLSLNTKFKDDIKTTPISDILMHILKNNYTSKIKLTNEISEEECTIKIKDKNIVDIEMEDFDIEDALFWVLNWDIASIEVSLIEEINNERCNIPIEEIIDEVINKRNEFDELSETLPDLGTILVQTSTYDSGLSDLEQEYKNIIELFDGTNTINDVISIINEDNIYVLTIISQLYMDEILILPEENNISKEELIPEKTSSLEFLKDDEEENISKDEENSLLSDYLTEENSDLNINTGVLEQDDNFEELDKEKYIDGLIESFKEEEEIIIRPKESPFKIALIVLFFINFILTIIIFIHKKDPQKITINNINKQEKIIKKIDLYNLGLENKIHYVKNKMDIVNDVLKQKILKQKKEITYKKIFEDKNLTLKLKKADFYMLKGNYKKAISMYKNILESVPNENQILLKLATAYYNNDDNNNSIKIIEKLNFLKDNSLNFIFLKAQVYQSINDLENSYLYYNEFLKRSNDDNLKKDVRIIIKNIKKKL